MANSNSQLLALRALLIVAAGFWVFAPALRGDWIMDDDMYLTQNALLHDPARLWKTWFAPGALIEYYPITASFQAVQWHLWHMDTLGYHLTNVVLHILSALLVWQLLEKFGLRFAWLGGLLFAIHPACVESVAWISELKNALSLPPFLLAMCAWIDFEEHRRPRDYLLALALFLIAMLCKISMALFPFVMLLYAWWRRGRIGWADVKASAPFFAISLVLGATTVLVGVWFREAHLQSGRNVDIGGFATHLALGGESIAFYFSKVVWPGVMLPVYPQWAIRPDAFVSFLPWPCLAGLLGWFWAQRATWGRHALLGVGFFLLNLLPFIGFNSVSFMTFTWVMDHFLYIPMIGLIGLFVAVLGRIEGLRSAAPCPWLAGALAAIFALLAAESHFYAAKFIGPEELWTYTLGHNRTSWFVYNNLGVILVETGREAQAVEAYRRALEFNPTSVEANNNLGYVLFADGRTDEAIAHYRVALRMNPHFTIALTNLGDALAREGKTQEALEYYRQALLANPNDAGARAGVAKLQPLQKSH